MAYEPALPRGEAVAGIDPPLQGSGGEGWLSALYLEMLEVRRLLEQMLLGQKTRAESEEENDL